VNIDEGGEDDGGFHLGAGKHVGDELGELGVAVDTLGIWGSEGGGAGEGEVYRFHGALNDIV